MTKNDFNRCQSDRRVYIRKNSDGDFIILLLYIYDMLVPRSNMLNINSMKKNLANTFAMKDLGATKEILGMKIVRERKNNLLKLS